MVRLTFTSSSSLYVGTTTQLARVGKNVQTTIDVASSTNTNLLVSRSSSVVDLVAVIPVVVTVSGKSATLTMGGSYPKEKNYKVTFHVSEGKDGFIVRLSLLRKKFQPGYISIIVVMALVVVLAVVIIVHTFRQTKAEHRVFHSIKSGHKK